MHRSQAWTTSPVGRPHLPHPVRLIVARVVRPLMPMWGPSRVPGSRDHVPKLAGQLVAVGRDAELRASLPSAGLILSSDVLSCRRARRFGFSAGTASHRQRRTARTPRLGRLLPDPPGRPVPIAALNGVNAEGDADDRGRDGRHREQRQVPHRGFATTIGSEQIACVHRDHD